MKNKFIKKAQELVDLGDQFIKEHGNKNFHKKAKDLLSQEHLHKFFNYEELVDFAFSKKLLPKQSFIYLEFSDLPFTIARGKECFIDIYFWRRRPTVIHNHHFRGAFQCLNGLNVDSEFKFKETKKITRYHSLGELKLIQTSTLSKGDIKAIDFQDKFIHQNHHQSDLTINLCFRTLDVAKKNLSNFLYSGFKFEKEQRAIARVERLFAFSRIEDIDPKILGLTLEDAFNFLLTFRGYESQNPRFLKLNHFFETSIKKQTGLKMTQLFKEHEKELDRIESLYE